MTRWVYEWHVQGRANSRLSQEVAMSLYGLQHLQLLRDPVTGTKCLVAWGPTYLVITFRGTANMKNAAHDTKFGRQGLVTSAKRSTHCSALV